MSFPPGFCVVVDNEDDVGMVDVEGGVGGVVGGEGGEGERIGDTGGGGGGGGDEMIDMILVISEVGEETGSGRIGCGVRWGGGEVTVGRREEVIWSLVKPAPSGSAKKADITLLPSNSWVCAPRFEGNSTQSLFEWWSYVRNSFVSPVKWVNSNCRQIANSVDNSSTHFLARVVKLPSTNVMPLDRDNLCGPL